MADAVYKVVTAEVEIEDTVLQTSGTATVFDGFTSLYTSAKDEDTEIEDGKQKLPDLKKGENLSLVAATGEQHFTTPPPRYNESSIIKTLEKEGIGRPSTYATIVDTIQQRKYVKKSEGKFYPSDAAFAVTHILESYFADLIDPGFTASMENELDKIEEGKVDWVKVLADFYEPFMKALKKAEESIEKLQIQSDINCPKCGKIMNVRLGQSGKFLACSAYPDCKSTINIPEEKLLFAEGIPKPPIIMSEILSEAETERAEEELELVNEKCDQCGSDMHIRTGRYGDLLPAATTRLVKTQNKLLKKWVLIVRQRAVTVKCLKKNQKGVDCFMDVQITPNVMLPLGQNPQENCVRYVEPLLFGILQKNKANI